MPLASDDVIVMFWLAVDAVGEVAEPRVTVGPVWSTVIVAVWVETFPTESVAWT